MSKQKCMSNRKIIAVLLIGAGLIGLVLPFVSGIVLIAFGMAMLQKKNGNEKKLDPTNTPSDRTCG